jgi:hypothetical protein
MRVTLTTARDCQRFLSHLLVARPRLLEARRQRPRQPSGNAGRNVLRAWRRLPWRDAIIGIGYGAKMKDGQYTNQLALKFYVLKKVHESRIAEAHRIPEMADLSAIGLGRIPTDVVELGGTPLAHWVPDRPSATSPEPPVL